MAFAATPGGGAQTAGWAGRPGGWCGVPKQRRSAGRLLELVTASRRLAGDGAGFLPAVTRADKRILLVTVSRWGGPPRRGKKKKKIPKTAGPCPGEFRSNWRGRERSHTAHHAEGDSAQSWPRLQADGLFFRWHLIVMDERAQ